MEARITSLKTAEQWAKEGIPGFPATKQGANRFFLVNEIEGRKRQGLGGGYVYPLSSLPKAAQQAYLDRLASEIAERNSAAKTDIEPHLPAVDSTSHLKEWQRRVMDARLAVLSLVEEIALLIGVNAAVAKVVEQAREGTLPDPVARLVSVANARGGKAGKRSLSRSRVFAWLAAKKNSPASLAPEANAERVPPWAAALLAAYRQPQKPSIHEAVRCLNERGILVSYDAARRFLKNKMSALELQRGRLGPRELATKVKMYRRRDLSNFEPLDVCQADGHSFKARVAHPFHGRAFFPEVEGVLDCVTRVCIGWSVGLAESASVVADAVLHAMTVSESKPVGGIPTILYSDRGAGNEAKTNSDTVIGLFARVGIKHETGIPGNAQARGLIERAQGSIWIRAAKKLPTYTGRGMSREIARKVYLTTEKDLKETGKSDLLIPWSDFLQVLAVSVHRYNTTPHRGLPRIRDSITGSLRHQTPLEAWAAWLEKGWRPVVPSTAEIEDWMRPRKLAIVQRGLVSLFGNTYGNRDLEHFHGKQVAVEFDIHDASQVWVRDLAGRLICTAKFDSNRTDFYPVSAVEKARNDRATRRLKLVDEKRAEIEAEREGPKRMAIELSPEQIAASERLQIEYDEIQSANAARAEEEQAKLAAVDATLMEEKAASAHRLWTTPQERYEELFARKRRGEELSGEELNFMEAHEEKYGFRVVSNGERSGCTPTALITP